MIKQILQFLKDKKFTIHTDSDDTQLSAYNIHTHFVVSYTASGNLMICYKNSSDIRFNGKIKNLTQLKLILELVSN